MRDERGPESANVPSLGDDLKEVVMGLHWDPRQPDAAGGAELINLDALCLALDEEGRMVDAVHPGRTRNANGSIVHTGDSATGASTWDDERIFVFLEALPPSVSAVEFAVSSATGQPLSEVPGACCHVSDRVSEREWIRIDLTAVGLHRACRVAMLRRGPHGWWIAPDTTVMDDEGFAVLEYAKAMTDRVIGNRPPR